MRDVVVRREGDEGAEGKHEGNEYTCSIGRERRQRGRRGGGGDIGLSEEMENMSKVRW